MTTEIKTVVNPQGQGRQKGFGKGQMFYGMLAMVYFLTCNTVI